MPEERSRRLEVTRVLPAARSTVFEAFSSADQLARWWGPRGFGVPSLDYRPRVGDAYRIEELRQARRAHRATQ